MRLQYLIQIGVRIDPGGLGQESMEIRRPSRPAEIAIQVDDGIEFVSLALEREGQSDADGVVAPVDRSKIPITADCGALVA